MTICTIVQTLARELKLSRERLVAAREKERRRLQRDLHDELGPTLASMSMQLDAAHGLLHDDPASGEALLAEVQAQLKATVSITNIFAKLGVSERSEAIARACAAGLA